MVPMLDVDAPAPPPPAPAPESHGLWRLLAGVVRRFAPPPPAAPRGRGFAAGVAPAIAPLLQRFKAFSMWAWGRKRCELDCAV